MFFLIPPGIEGSNITLLFLSDVKK